jgi:hypothetical protein
MESFASLFSIAQRRDIRMTYIVMAIVPAVDTFKQLERRKVIWFWNTFFELIPKRGLWAHVRNQVLPNPILRAFKYF